MHWRRNLLNDVKLQEGHPVDENLRPLKVGGVSSSLEIANTDNGVRVRGDLDVTGDNRVQGDLEITGDTYASIDKMYSGLVPAYAGMILGYTAIGIDAASASYAVTGSYAVTDADHKVTFVAPPSGNVEIFVSISVLTVAVRELFFGLSDNATYAAIHFPNADDVTNEHNIGDIQIEGFERELVHNWVVEGLTAGTEYTWYLGAKAEQAGRITVKWGGNAGDEFAPFIMKATALPSTIYNICQHLQEKLLHHFTRTFLV